MIHLTDAEFLELTRFVKQKYGIDLSKKRVLIEGRLSNLLRERGLTTFQDYLKLIKNDSSGAEVTGLLNRITTNHSYFMREQEHFSFLQKQVLPYLCRVHARDHDLRIWSAGCSAGQEAYTIAMAIDDYFGPEKSKWDTTILATDISMKVLDKARRAVYSADNLSGLPKVWQDKYLTKQPDGQYQVCEKLRREVVFKPFNLMETFSFRKPFDLIFCRNVMIYFDNPTRDKLVKQFYDVTAPGGYLFIGHSEVINRDITNYQFLEPAIYQKREK
ncbi:MAG: protein-glutamate O-methyltransferase CheR [Oscillospiraceae bacterium]|nr:protein-glutamate O-methyltransferase CheR [Oscillospiraceae bacterium]